MRAEGLDRRTVVEGTLNVEGETGGLRMIWDMEVVMASMVSGSEIVRCWER